MRWLVTINSFILVISACAPQLPYDCGCVDAGNPDLLTEHLGQALTDAIADGQFSCEDHQARNQYNICPEHRPQIGTDENGVTWVQDLILGIFPNPYHVPLDCFRGTSPDIGVSSFQCCYDGENLVGEGTQAGSFDFVSPFQSLITTIAHYIFDIVPDDQCPVT
ncbi:MAG: hypothetical protein JSV03_13525 [Planctomycetota bacterium]|nr:MAG: hypothetical protein JSV03_13525 [Planctomycetota bacterium]